MESERSASSDSLPEVESSQFSSNFDSLSSNDQSDNIQDNYLQGREIEGKRRLFKYCLFVTIILEGVFFFIVAIAAFYFVFFHHYHRTEHFEKNDTYLSEVFEINFMGGGGVDCSIFDVKDAQKIAERSIEEFYKAQNEEYLEVQYSCSGSCFCDDDSSSGVTQLSGRSNFLIDTIHSLEAYEISKTRLSDQCLSDHDDKCDDVHSEIDLCVLELPSYDNGVGTDGIFCESLLEELIIHLENSIRKIREKCEEYGIDDIEEMEWIYEEIILGGRGGTSSGSNLVSKCSWKNDATLIISILTLVVSSFSAYMYYKWISNSIKSKDYRIEAHGECVYSTPFWKFWGEEFESETIFCDYKIPPPVKYEKAVDWVDEQNWEKTEVWGEVLSKTKKTIVEGLQNYCMKKFGGELEGVAVYPERGMARYKDCRKMFVKKKRNDPK